MSRKRRIYLAAPYSHPSPTVCQWRTEMADKAAAHFMQRGYVVFSPLSHSHRISRHINNSQDLEFWMEQDLPWLECCDRVKVLTIPGWKGSSGIKRELTRSSELGLPVKLVAPHHAGVDMAAEIRRLARRRKAEARERLLIEATLAPPCGFALTNPTQEATNG